MSTKVSPETLILDSLITKKKTKKPKSDIIKIHVFNFTFSKKMRINQIGLNGTENQHRLYIND